MEFWCRDGRYDKLKRFLTGELDVLHTFRSHAPEAIRPLVESAEIQREFDLLQIEGRDASSAGRPTGISSRPSLFSYRLIIFSSVPCRIRTGSTGKCAATANRCGIG